MPVSINGQTGVVTGLAALPDSAMASGSIIQVLQVGKTGTTTVQSSGNNVYSDIPNFSLAITPSSTSSKILVMVALTVGGDSGAFSLKLFRDSTEIGSPSSGVRPAMIHRFTDEQYYDSNIINFLDSPNTTSAITYKLQMSTHGNLMYINRWTLSVNFESASYLTLMEVAG
tara:strand:+ start:365 stop:877 length:513 start_codon:yes stop_codon:yes gene_type:complete